MDLYTLNFTLAVCGLTLLAGTIFLYADYFYFKSRYFNQYLKSFAWPLILATSIGGLVITLIYSEYFGFVPCSLCWLQRIALYPQALFAIMAFKTKESVFFPLYSIGLSVLGFLVAVYHYIYQMVPKELTEGIVPCLADGSADCASVIMKEFGFVTFPLLSAVMFAFLIVIYLNLRKAK